MNKQTVSTLQQAIIDAGLDTIAFHNGGADYPVKVSDLPDASLIAILNYGKRMFNDSVNSAKGQGAVAEQAAMSWMDKARKGELGIRTGGARISPLEKAKREIVVEYLRKAGWDTKDAQKDAKDPENAFSKMLELQIARGRGVPTSEVTAEDIESAFDKNWPKVEARAAKMVALTETTLDIDL